MGKTLVIDSDERTRVPFLRGILTRSLQEAGLRFEDAYQLADSVRQELGETSAVSAQQLRARVIKRLEGEYGRAVVDRYQDSSPSVTNITVRKKNGQVSTFSRSKHSRDLECSGLSTEESDAVTNKLYRHLLSKGTWEVSSRYLGHFTYRYLHADKNLGPAVARRYLVWVDFKHSCRPLMILVGGAPGCGKSTIATALANQLEIVRTQSTDMLREVMRMMIPKRLVPILHASSFLAADALPSQERAKDNEGEQRLTRGYQIQAELLSVAMEAVVRRALRKRVSLVLEGIHVQPAFVEKIPQDTDALVLPIMLAVLNPGTLRKRMPGHGTDDPSPKAGHYLRHFDAIWSLQSFLLSEADRLGVTLIDNNEKDTVLREIMRIMIYRLSANFSGAPREVFR